MKTSFAIIASVVLFSCVPAFAQNKAPLASADPAVIEATKQMLTVMKVRDSMKLMLASIEQQMPAQARAGAAASINSNPTLTPQQKAEQLKKAEEGIAASFGQLHTVFADPTLVDEIIAETVPLYAETYTLDEIRQLTAFYASPLGQKMQASLPQLMARSTEISQRVLMPRMQKIMGSATQAGPK